MSTERCHKKVRFSCDVEFISTFANEEYDRTAQEVAKLSYTDMYELLTLKAEWRRETEQVEKQLTKPAPEQQKPCVISQTACEICI
ncbi:hypothetical protein J3Q64DRAFT_1734340 [Phycomyces blakesleeanus]|uniref:Uncharacterized protein n=2 Tax=Phycomyces blakesleeanus TaxID=4837 RepID=A0A163D898_PHYB8|nr:hypothetical protein PHYBLDRAFT_149269 [Phycomyces blakesleeanus NRRL 1555(-)]OAD69480.1 hypothetical protein PHYBLDRAFT_149269 [Phycomyces blakesleeanus NRRL 1555(-)]|eukprot:XP_018287520.1 hypothetical protein PHYBLDRAFT_149269 [Phycomyces blakesleeanus NRRL 1555(-)]